MKWLKVTIENQQYVCSLDSRNSSGRETKGFHKSLSDVTKGLPLSLEILIFLTQPLNVWCYTPFGVGFDKPKKSSQKLENYTDKVFFIYIWQDSDHEKIIQKLFSID